MSNVQTPTPEAPPAGADPGGDPRGFEIQQKRRWPWVAGGAAVLLIGAFAFTQFGGDSPSANEQAGATLTVAEAQGNRAQVVLAKYIAEEVAPKYGLHVKFRAIDDSTEINRAVSEGQ